MKKHILPSIIIALICIWIMGILICNISIAVTIQDMQNISSTDLSNNEEMNINTSKAESNAQIVSAKYAISDIYSYITAIAPKTTIDQFKKGFNVEAAKVRVYKDDTLKEEITSGYMKTKMGIKFEGIAKTYVAIVAGDINGDGLCNQIEVQRINKHIIGYTGSRLTGIDFIAADLNNDGRVNQIDLRNIIDYVVYGRIIIEKPDTPTKPRIEIETGALGKNGYYVSYPTIRVIETQMRNVGKTTYKIEGAINQKETEIANNGKIKLTKSGTYTITSYTYSKEGVSSRSFN